MNQLPYLYALPDHEVTQRLLPHAARRYLSVEQALPRIKENRGLIPIAIDPTCGGKVFWADIGRHPFREWQFMYSIQCLSRRQDIGDAFVTDIEILLREEIIEEAVRPSGFIFHISRCGSTLFAKALARSAKHLMINQGGPLQRGFWASSTNDWRHPLPATADRLKMFRHIVLAMARRRIDSQQTCFVKFISWNVLYVDFIRRAFPEIPCMFLYRNPVEVMASVFKETTAALLAKGTREGSFLSGRNHADTASMSGIDYLTKCYANYFRAALSAEGADMTYLNYHHLQAKNFSAILRHAFGYEPSTNELDLMRTQFEHHAKDDTDRTRFTDDRAIKQATISHDDRRIVERELSGLFEQIELSGSNLAARLGQKPQQHALAWFGFGANLPHHG